MIDILNFIFTDFWHFLGAFILVTVPFNFVTKMTKILIDGRNTRLHGWNPTQPTTKEEADV